MNKQIAKGVTSPFTSGEVYLVEDSEVQTFRKEEFTVHVHYYMCKDTGEKFTTEEQDEELCNELYNSYRSRHGIPTPEEIRDIRERYGLSYSQITKIVGFGQNQWRQYENGCIPSESNGRMILAIKSREGMLMMLDACREQFDESTYRKIRSSVLCAPDDATQKQHETEQVIKKLSSRLKLAETAIDFLTKRLEATNAQLQRLTGAQLVNQQ